MDHLTEEYLKSTCHSAVLFLWQTIILRAVDEIWSLMEVFSNFISTDTGNLIQ
jgi:hypothetical protein